MHLPIGLSVDFSSLMVTHLQRLSPLQAASSMPGPASIYSEHDLACAEKGVKAEVMLIAMNAMNSIFL